MAEDLRKPARLGDHGLSRDRPRVVERDAATPIKGTSSSSLRSRLGCAWYLYPLAVITALPVALTSKLWLKVLLGVRPRSWDGISHYSIGQIYDQQIFPDTFGWTHAYFGGMPFPNFYPPLFHWCVALLHHAHLLSLSNAFKLLVTLPVLLLPIAIWTLARVISDKSRLVSHWAALASLLLLVHYRFQMPIPMGLDYVSTFDVGLYTQPLGLLLLIAWYAVYIAAHRRPWRFALACILLALTILANFFIAIAAALFVGSNIISDVVRYYTAPDCGERDQTRRAFIAHFCSPLISVCLSLFWLVPMLSTYQYLVTQPVIYAFSSVFRIAFLGWYALALIGMINWLRRSTPFTWPFLATCLALASGVIFSQTIAPAWFPLHPQRLLSTLNFLLAVPVGQALSDFHRRLAAFGAPLINQLKLRRQARSFALLLVATVFGLVLSSVLSFKRPASIARFVSLVYGDTETREIRAFIPTADNERIEPVLRFARQHREGRYLIEVPQSIYMGARGDSREINSLLGAQGNEAASVAYQEASPNALFFIPMENAFSKFSRQGLVISSVLADDINFDEQPLSQHLAQAQFLGIKYLVVCSPQIKDDLASEVVIKARYDFADWSIFELVDEPQPRVRALSFRPALVVSSLRLKQRRRNQYSFTRLAEEQFAAAWFDVLLVHSPESKIDRLRDANRFGALILDTYDCDDQNTAFARLRDFAHQRPLILLSSDAALFKRIRESIADFPLAEIIERAPNDPGETMNILASKPTFRYELTSIRKEWREIQRTLNRVKIAVNTGAETVGSEFDRNMIWINLNAATTKDAAPILISTTYHPNWRRDDGGDVYASVPFFMLTFVNQPTRIIYARRWLDWVGLFTSASTLMLLCCFTAIASLSASDSHTCTGTDLSYVSDG